MAHAVGSLLARKGALHLLSDDSQALLRTNLQPVVIATGEVLFHYGAPVDGCYVVEEGALKVSIIDHTAAEIWLAILGAGDWVGEVGLIDRNPRSATVTAMTRCRLSRLAAKDFDTLKAVDSEFYHWMARLICEKLRATNRQVRDERLNLQGRLAQTMLKLAKAFGESLPDGRILIRYKIDQSHLGEIAGASRENVNRQFSAWRKAGLWEKVDGYHCIREIQKWGIWEQNHFAADTG